MERSHLQGNGLLQQSRSTKRHFWSLLDGATLDGTMYWPIIKDLVSRHLGAIRFRTLNCTERKLDDFMNLIFPASGRKMPLYRQQQQVQPAHIEVRDMVAFCCSPAGCDRMFEVRIHWFISLDLRFVFIHVSGMCSLLICSFSILYL